MPAGSLTDSHPQNLPNGIIENGTSSHAEAAAKLSANEKRRQRRKQKKTEKQTGRQVDSLQ